MLLGNWTGGLKSGLPMIGPPKIFNLVQSSTSRTVCSMQCLLTAFLYWLSVKGYQLSSFSTWPWLPW